MREVALIGFGRFGRFLGAALAAQGVRVLAADRAPFRAPAGVRRVTLAEAARAPVVLLALPAGALRPVLRSVAPHLSRGALVVNLAAVQELPARWMRAELPADARLLGLHCLFGPTSARAGLRGHRAVLCPLRIGRVPLARARAALRGAGIIPVTATAAAHDRAMARSLFLTQLLGRSVGPLLERGAMRTRNAELLGAVADAASADAAAVLADLLRYNRHTRPMARALLRRLRAAL